MPGERRKSLLLYLCCVFRALINSLVCWFFSIVCPNTHKKKRTLYFDVRPIKISVHFKRLCGSILELVCPICAPVRQAPWQQNIYCRRVHHTTALAGGDRFRWPGSFPAVGTDDPQCTAALCFSFHLNDRHREDQPRHSSNRTKRAKHPPNQPVTSISLSINQSNSQSIVSILVSMLLYVRRDPTDY